MTAESLNARAGAAIEAGRFADAVEPLKQALKLKPDYADAHYNLGVALNSLGRPDEAIESFKRAVALDPDDSESQFDLGEALYAKGKYAEAAEAFAHVTRVAQVNAEAFENLGDSYRALEPLRRRRRPPTATRRG